MKSVLTVLTLIFIVLKLTCKIDWSWWLVLAPFIFEIALLSALEIWKALDPVGFMRFWL